MRHPLLELTTLALAVATGCAPQPRPSEPRPSPQEPPFDPAMILQHYPMYRRFEGCPSPAQAIVRRFGLQADSIHQCLAQRFVLAPGDTVALAHVAFGEAHDCFMNCFYQHLCAVVDGDDILPFAFHFLATSSHHDPGRLTGRRHRIVRDSSFLRFYHAIIRGGWEGVPDSVWRYCTDGLPLDMSSDSVRLEVVDWGGQGPTLILLAGLGHTAHVFDGFAPRLTSPPARSWHNAKGSRRVEPAKGTVRLHDSRP